MTLGKLGKTIEVNLSTNRLTFYDGLKVRKVYPVATGQPSFPTPQGTWRSSTSRGHPTWTNPAPDGWGKGMPKSIPPGPGNPLGTRAMSLNASGILITAPTPAGRSAPTPTPTAASACSCRTWSLYPQVPMGTPVLVHR